MRLDKDRVGITLPAAFFIARSGVQNPTVVATEAPCRQAGKTVKFKGMISVMPVLLFCGTPTGVRPTRSCLNGTYAIRLLSIYLSSLIKCFTVSVGFFNSVLKNSGYILMSSSSEAHTKCSLLLSSIKLSLIGAKASGTFI